MPCRRREWHSHGRRADAQARLSREGDRQDVQSGVLGTVDRAEPAGRFGELEVTLEVKGAGAAYAAGVRPECDPFLRAAGFSSTVDATGGNEKVTYTTLDEGMETMTLYCYTGRKLIKLIGCVATLKASAEANKRGFLTFGITGRVATDPTESALPGGLTLLGREPAALQGASRGDRRVDTASGDPLVLRKVDARHAGEDGRSSVAGATDGHAGYVITDRIVRQTMDVEVVPLATFDPFAMSKARRRALPAATSWQIGTAQYNRMKVVTGRWALEAPTGRTTPGHRHVGSPATWCRAPRDDEPRSQHHLRLRHRMARQFKPAPRAVAVRPRGDRKLPPEQQTVFILSPLIAGRDCRSSKTRSLARSLDRDGWRTCCRASVRPDATSRSSTSSRSRTSPSAQPKPWPADRERARRISRSSTSTTSTRSGRRSSHSKLGAEEPAAKNSSTPEPTSSSGGISPEAATAGDSAV
jgi:hypothetical protein